MKPTKKYESLAEMPTHQDAKDDVARKFRTATLILMAMAVSAISMSFFACKLNDADELANLLEKKYGVEFVVKAIGNRLADDRLADGETYTVKAYCCPKNNDKVVFEAVMSSSRELISDTYPVRLLEIEAKERIDRKFSENGIKAIADVSISHLPESIDLLHMTLQQVIENCPDLSLTFTTIISDGATAKNTYAVVAEILNDFYSGDPAMLLGTTLWKYTDESYEKCAKEMNSIPNIGKTVLEEYGPLTKVTVAMNNGAINMGFEDFAEEFSLSVAETAPARSETITKERQDF